MVGYRKSPRERRPPVVVKVRRIRHQARPIVRRRPDASAAHDLGALIFYGQA